MEGREQAAKVLEESSEFVIEGIKRPAREVFSFLCWSYFFDRS